MNEYLLISIRPEHVKNILNGIKTIELRKVVPNWVKENIKNGKTVKCLIYCTKNKPYLQHFNGYHIFNKLSEYEIILNKTLNGKIVAEFDLNKIDMITNEPSYEIGYNKFKDKSNVTFDDWYNYFTWSRNGNGYALHIENLNIIEPRELSDFETKHVFKKNTYWYGSFEYYYKDLNKAPQNMMKVWSSKWINKVTELK